MQVRVAEAADAEEIVRLKGLLMQTWPDPHDPEAEDPTWPARAAQAVREMIADDGHHRFWVIGTDDEPGSRLVACISALLERHIPGPTWSGVSAYLGDMYVDESLRGTGLGSQLMNEVFAWCEAQGARRARLSATPQAIAIYEHLGFERRTGPEKFPQMWKTFEGQTR